MFTLMLWVCLASHPTDCRAVAVVDGFVSMEKCMAAVPITVAGFMDLTHGAVVKREGVKPVCSDQANFLLHRFKA